MDVRKLPRVRSWTKKKKKVINRLMKIDTALYREGGKAA